MLFNVPQFIDIEDKIVGPLTAKQLGWLGIAGVLLLIFWGTLTFSTFVFVAIITLGIFGALAFYRPYNQPLSNLIMSGINYFIKPKVYVWKRYYDNIKATSQVSVHPKEEVIIRKKVLDNKKIEELTKILNQK
ncbi:MAG TPA: PrgI family protein [Candidatus Moranbacteria bacterium]|nr:PrgI family protein [Candidatus Moranbacteria bacterium]